MIPLKLTIKGLYSYREEQVIDFTKLAENHLFGIFGAVGSGKSAILEAMTYALYGETARLGGSDKRSYNMMNLQSQEMLIVFEFKTATNEGESLYQFRVRHTRNSKKFDDVRSPARTASIWKDAEWQPLPTTDAESILKLSYENFIKTIIIPQGKFQEFMHMGETQRTRMLRELFGLDRFELSIPTGQLIKETETALSVLQGQLMSLTETNPEEMAAKEAELLEIGDLLEKEKAQLQLLEIAVASIRQLKKLADDRLRIQETLNSLLSKKEEWERREAKANQFQKVVLDFRELVNTEKRLTRELELARNAHSKTVSDLELLLPQLKSAREAAVRAKLAWEARGELEAKIKDCTHLEAIRKATDALIAIEERLKKGEALLLTEAQAIQEKKKAKETADSTIATLRQTMPDEAQVNEALAWYQQRRNLHTQLETSNAQGKAIEAERFELFAEQLTLAKTHLGVDHTGEMLSEALQTALDHIQAEIQAARLDKEQITHKEGLAAYAVDLVAGNPCPLCGAVHHPAPYHPGEAVEKIKSSELVINALEAKLKPLERALASANAISVRLEEKEKQLSNQQTEAVRIQNLLAEHSKAFLWPQYDAGDATKAESDRIEAGKIKSKIIEIESQRSAIDKDLETLLGNQERYRTALERLREERSQSVGLRDSHLQQRTVFVSESDLQLSLEEIAALSQELSAELKSIEFANTTTQETERNLDMKRVELEQRQLSTNSDLVRLEKDAAENKGKIAGMLSASGFASVAEVESILGWNLDLESEQKAVTAFKMELQTAESALAMLVAQAGNEEYNAQKHAETESAILASKAQIDEKTERQSLLREALKRIREELAQRKALEGQQEAQRRRLENLKILERLFVGSGFVKYVSTKYLQELVARADVRFRQLTRNALSLELGTENEFLVRDMLNGGQTRSVKTLSGGQTFQASLCLALALADNVQQHSGSSHNFFFLDEGFGTLDKESLAAVFEALKQLREENRIVGVISHVEEMQQEIEVFLKVTQTEERGSLVKGSWE